MEYNFTLPGTFPKPSTPDILQSSENPELRKVFLKTLIQERTGKRKTYLAVSFFREQPTDEGVRTCTVWRLDTLYLKRSNIYGSTTIRQYRRDFPDSVYRCSLIPHRTKSDPIPWSFNCLYLYRCTFSDDWFVWFKPMGTGKIFNVKTFYISPYSPRSFRGSLIGVRPLSEYLVETRSRRFQ